jgi:Tol biopolymer transport system component
VKRSAVALSLLVVSASGCAVGAPVPTTYISDRGATFNADVGSNQPQAEYWWRYGTSSSYGNETPHATIATPATGLVPVSRPVSGLTASTTYHFQVCAQDQQESPPRTICSEDRTFTTGSAGGRSGIAYLSIRDGNFEIYVASDRITNSSFYEGAASFSPDGRRLAYEGQGGIWTINADGSNPSPLPAPAFVSNITPKWSPDGQRIAVSSTVDPRESDYEVVVMDADGSDPVALTDNTTADQPLGWSPDGRKLAYLTDPPDLPLSLYTMNPDGSGKKLVKADFAAFMDWSPDARRIAYDDRRAPASGGGIYVMNADGSNPTRIVADTIAGGVSWSPDGTQIAYTRTVTFGNDEVMVVNVTGGTPVNYSNNSFQDILPDWSRRP